MCIPVNVARSWTPLKALPSNRRKPAVQPLKALLSNR
jgi:hypothetical protein